MSVLIIAEHDNDVLSASTLAVVRAGQAIAVSLTSEAKAHELHLIIIGYACSKVVEQALQLQIFSKILVADRGCYQHQVAENVAPLLVDVGIDYSHILTASGSVGKDVMPRVAALLDVAQLSDIIRVESATIFKRPIYAGNAIATVQSNDRIKVITVRCSAFTPSPVGTVQQAEVVQLNQDYNAGLSAFIDAQLNQSTRPTLSDAKIIIAGGRGMQNKANFTLLETIADQLGGAVGASRAAVDAGFVSNDLQIGQTGKIVAPELYIAVGISGAIQHLAGIADSKVIVAINKDADAPICAIADYVLVADLFVVLPELIAQLAVTD